MISERDTGTSITASGAECLPLCEQLVEAFAEKGRFWTVMGTGTPEGEIACDLVYGDDDVEVIVMGPAAGPICAFFVRNGWEEFVDL